MVVWSLFTCNVNACMVNGVKVARVRQSTPDSGLGFPGQFVEMFRCVSSSLRSGLKATRCRKGVGGRDPESSMTLTPDPRGSGGVLGGGVSLHLQPLHRLHCRRYALRPTLYTLHPSPSTLHPTPYTLHPAPFTLHPSPSTPHPTPYTLHPSPYTLHPAAYPLNPQHLTLNPKPKTLHSTPYTLHSTPYTLHAQP